MRLIRYTHEGQTRIGVEVQGGVLPSRHSDLRTLIEAGPEELAALRDAAELPDPAEIAEPERLLAPIAERCQSAVIGPGEPIRIPSPDTHADWEAELAIVIGRTAHQVPAERALDYVFGYAMVNDVSARRHGPRAAAGDAVQVA